ncbi:MAG: hypothetical protein KY433_05560 [Actinobacteria bacterium]|nr:hypothetical protein [Actinomycetota bacterium]
MRSAAAPVGGVRDAIAKMSTPKQIGRKSGRVEADYSDMRTHGSHFPESSRTTPTAMRLLRNMRAAPARRSSGSGCQTTFEELLV